MNELILVLNEFAAAWWAWTVTSTGQGLLLLAVLALVLWGWKSMRPGLRYGLLLVVLVKLAVPPVFGATYGFSDLIARAFAEEPASLPVARPVEVTTGPVISRTVEAPVAMATPEPVKPKVSLAVWALLLVVVGALLMLALIARQLFATRSTLRAAEQCDELLTERLRRVAKDMGGRRVPRLYVSASFNAPQSGGVFRPFVSLPAWALALDSDDLDILLAHELAHIRRMDALVNTLQAVAQALLWWNPAVWWLNRRIREEREFCCDDLVLSRGIASGAAYSRALVNVAERVSLPQPTWALAGMADNFGAIDRRVRRALEGGYTESGWRRYGALVSLLLVAGWVLPGATEDEIKAGAGAAIGVGDVEAFSNRGIKPSWPMVTYSLEEFLDWENDRLTSREEILNEPGSVTIAVRGIQVDRDAGLTLPDGRTLTDWLTANESDVGVVTEAVWSEFGKKLHALRASRQADFTHLSRGVVAKGGKRQVTMPTAIDRWANGSASVEYVALSVGMMPNLISQADGSSAIELDLDIDQFVVAENSGAKSKYKQVAASKRVRIENAQDAKWIFFVSDTNGSRVNIVGLRLALAKAAVARQVMIESMIVEIERDADLALPYGFTLAEFIDGTIHRSGQRPSDGLSTGPDESNDLHVGQVLFVGPVDKWSSCKESIVNLNKQGRAKIMSAPKVTTVDGEKASISVGRVVPNGEEKVTSNFLGFSQEILPTLQQAGDGSDAIMLEMQFKLTTQGEPLDGTPEESVDELYTKVLLGASGRWLCGAMGTSGERVRLLFLKADIVGHAGAPGD